MHTEILSETWREYEGEKY